MSQEFAFSGNDFEYVGESRIDDRKRVSLGKALDYVKRLYGDESTLRFAIFRNGTGEIFLSPQVSVPASEVWLYDNSSALGAVGKGLEEAANGDLLDLGSFERFADEDIE